MTRLAFAACTGAPRDIGLDQAHACRDEVRADLRAAGLGARASLLARLRGGRRAGPAARLARDLARHFPHLDERTAGLAQGVGAAHADLVALLARELADELRTSVHCDPAAHVLVLRWLAPLPSTGLVVRETRPDGGHASLTVSRPGLVFAVAGVNEHGLAGALETGPWRDAAQRWGAPGALLLDQCLERLDTVEKALEWCERRPGAGRSLLVFADAAGATGALQIDGDKRSRVDPATAPRADAGGPWLRVDVAARALAIEDVSGVPARFALGSGR